LNRAARRPNVCRRASPFAAQKSGGEVGFVDKLDVAGNGARIPFQDIILRNTMVFDDTGLPGLMLASGLEKPACLSPSRSSASPFRTVSVLLPGRPFQRLPDHRLMKPPKAA